jgi:hypothetical protein
MKVVLILGILKLAMALYLKGGDYYRLLVVIITLNVRHISEIN